MSTKPEYGKYLASREWGLKTRAVKERADGICERCHGRPIRSTHHNDYTRIGHEEPLDLDGTCDDCHKYLNGKCDLDPLFNRLHEVRVYLVYGDKMEGIPANLESGAHKVMVVALEEARRWLGVPWNGEEPFLFGFLPIPCRKENNAWLARTISHKGCLVAAMKPLPEEWGFIHSLTTRVYVKDGEIEYVERFDLDYERTKRWMDEQEEIWG